MNSTSLLTTGTHHRIASRRVVPSNTDPNDTPWKTTCNARGAKLDVSKLTYNPAQVIRISNLPTEASIENLEQSCARYGRVVMAHISKQSAFRNVALGTVVMESASEAEGALKGLQGVFFGAHEISVVSLSTELEKRNDSFIRRQAEDSRSVNPSMTGRALTTFTCFGKLPPEIRVIIWKASQSPGRTVQIEWDIETNARVFHSQLPGCLNHLLNDYVSVYKSRNPVPSHLHVCREARSEALKVYELAFAYGESRGEESPRTYFDFSKDELYISMPPPNPEHRSQRTSDLRGITRCLSIPESGRIKHLAFDIEKEVLSSFHPGSPTFGNLVMRTVNQHMPAVERIRPVFNNHLALTKDGQANIDKIQFRRIFQVDGDTDCRRNRLWRTYEYLRNRFDIHRGQDTRIHVESRPKEVEWSAMVLSRRV